jgi:K+-sensing histidine kinase KdpD
MDMQRTLVERRPMVVAVAALVPLVMCLVLTVLWSSVPAVSAALLLVLAVVAAAATGIRAAGVVAALSSALWFDVLLTEPKGQLVITSPADVEATVLLVAVGLAVSELALWGRRQQDRASRTTGYLAGLVDTAVSAMAVAPADTADLTTSVALRLTEVLGLDRCRYLAGPPSNVAEPMLTADGTVLRSGRVLNVSRHGLPVDAETALLVRSGGYVVGHFLLTAATRVVRPSADQLRVAVLLADQVGAALSPA